MKSYPATLERIVGWEIGSAIHDGESRELFWLARGKTVLEVGSWHGRSTIAMALEAKVVHSVDWHRGEAASHKDIEPQSPSLAALFANVMRYDLLDKVVLHVGTTAQVCPFLKPKSFDLVFVDGDHTTEGVLEDIRQVRPLMKAGATWAFHDYTWEGLGVTEAVDQTFPKVRVVNTMAVVDP